MRGPRCGFRHGRRQPPGRPDVPRSAVPGPALARLTGTCLLALTFLLVTPGCHWRRADMPPALEGDPVTIGIPLPLTGAKAAFGEAKRNAYQMAVEEVNAAGGVDGHPLVLEIKDTAGEPEAAVSAAEELITVKEVDVLAGEYSSACALAVANVAERHKTPYVVDSAVADKITQQECPYVFRLNPPAGLLAQGLTSFFGEVVHPTSVAIVYERSDYGSSLAKAMREWCHSGSVKVVVDKSYEPGGLDLASLLAGVKDAGPDVLYVASYLMDASLIVRQARAQDLRPRLFAGGGSGFALPEFIVASGQAAENVVTAAPWAPSLGYPGAAEFAETYRARYGEYPGYHAAQSYTCLYVLADALGRAASTDPDRVRAALADTDLLTAFGPVRFEKFGKYLNQNRVPTVVLQVRNGLFEVIWPPECATADYVFPDPHSTGATER